MPKVVRITERVPGAVRVDRATVWGNPFHMYSEDDREKVCAHFEAYAEKRVTDDPTWLEPLRGKDLACWCAPKRCHAETLLRLANRQRDGGGG